MKTMLIIMTASLMGFSSCKKEETNGNSNTITLTTQEKSDLIFLREEEKLAHDVYVYAFAKYGLVPFSNISSSEAVHMSNVLVLLNKYNIPDPVKNNPEGVFTDTVLQNLYNDLIVKVNLSSKAALEVGATIEDLDIHDILGFYSHTSKADIIQVYDLLTCGSRNHIRAYAGQLEMQSVTYLPQFIAQVEYDAILAAPHEQCGMILRNAK